jgi:hypothetical protein
MDVLILLDQAREAGLAIASDGDKLIVRGPKQAASVARLLGEHKRQVLTALDEATNWPARHREAVKYWSALHGTDEAVWLAWGEMQSRWHRLRGERVPEWQCAGCGEPIGGLAPLPLADGNRVHADKFQCLLWYGERWRGEATAALQALGLDPPPGSTA